MIPVISIIIPVYNVEEYLGRCLNSILNQSFTEWECILVDDGSSDSSGAICDLFKKKDNRFKAIHISNGGVSNARNTAFKIAKGEWVAFIDSDDFVDQSYLADMMKFRDSGADLIFIGSQKVDENNHTFDVNRYDEGVYKLNNIHTVIEPLVRSGTPWGRMYKRDIISKHNLQFNTNLYISEDRVFTYQYLAYITGVAFSNKVGYFYFINSQSLSFKPKPVSQYVIASQEMYKSMLTIFQKWSLTLIDGYPIWTIHVSRALMAYNTAQKNKEKIALEMLIGGYFRNELSNYSFSDIISIYKRIGIRHFVLSCQNVKMYELLTKIKSII